MEQLHLLPQLGAIQEPLPAEVLRDASQLLAELLSEVIDLPIDLPPNQEGETDE